MAVFGSETSIRPELTGLTLALEECPVKEDLTVLTESKSSMDLLQSMQRADFPRWLYRNPARQPLVHVARLINQRAVAGVVTRLVQSGCMQATRSMRRPTPWHRLWPS